MPQTGARSRARSAVRAAALLLFVMLLGGCLLPPAPKTDAGQDVFNLYILVLALAALVFVGVEGFIVYAIVRYRRQPGDDALPEQHHGNTKVEILWTAIPSVIVLILFVMSVITLGSVEARSDQPGVTIEVVAKQWTWDFNYPEGVAITGSSGQAVQLPLPVGEPVRLVITSADVNHAFFVPEFLIKRDAIDMGENAAPNEIEFVVTEAGTYAGQCAEFCGVGHNDMIFEVNAMARADYDVHMAALAAGETPPPPPGGEDCATTIEIAAVEPARFDTDTLEAPAGEDFCIELTNNDTVDHDIGIQEIEFNGEDVAPGESITYLIPAMEAGDYTFLCTIHPQTMVGDLVVGE
ncbi:MAG: cytochrome c oxidase subunit II [Chloroflexi bacterium]|nr:cytochrome c oxidase subunit II [Chloroflexota bacterium]